MKTTALIIAGGHGERFLPKSRKNLPKQFLYLTGDGKTMIQLTIERIVPLVAMEDKKIYTLPETFGWDDVGSWLAVERIKNPMNSEMLLWQCYNN